MVQFGQLNYKEVLRFEMMFRKTPQMLSLRKKTNAHRAVTEIIKRKPR